MWQWLHRYPILNLRFILRFLSISNVTILIIILCFELFRPVQDLLSNDGTQLNSFGGTECEDYRGRLRLPADMWNIYTKILALCYLIWLFYKISVIFFPLATGYWLYNNQEKLYTYRTTVIIVAGFNILPLLLLGIFDCLYARFYFCIAPCVVFLCLLVDRIIIRADDYFKLCVGDIDLIPHRVWNAGAEWKKDETIPLLGEQQPQQEGEILQLQPHEASDSQQQASEQLQPPSSSQPQESSSIPQQSDTNPIQKESA